MKKITENKLLVGDRQNDFKTEVYHLYSLVPLKNWFGDLVLCNDEILILYFTFFYAYMQTVPACQNLYKNSFTYHCLQDEKILPFDDANQFLGVLFLPVLKEFISVRSLAVF